MKFLNLKKLISLAVCMMLIIDMSVALERKHRMQRSYRVSRVQSHKSREVVPNYVLTANITNPWGRLALGALEGLTEKTEVIYKCMPKDWVQTQEDPGKAGYLEKNFEGLSNTTKTILDGIKTVLSLFCKPLALAIKAITDLLTLIFKDNGEGRSFIEGKYKLKRFRNRWQLWDWLVAKAKDAGEIVVKNLKSAWDYIENSVKDVFTNIYHKILEFKNKVLGIFQGEMFKQIMSVADCVIAAGKEGLTMANIKISLEKSTLLKNVEKKIAAIASMALVIPYIAKMIWTIICSWEEYIKAVNYAVAAYNTENRSDKYYFWGKFIGTLVGVLGNTLIGRKRFRRKFK